MISHHVVFSPSMTTVLFLFTFLLFIHDSWIFSTTVLTPFMSSEKLQSALTQPKTQPQMSWLHQTGPLIKMTATSLNTLSGSSCIRSTRPVN